MIRSILKLKDSPHAIAMGVAIGVFIGWTPTVGIQMLLALVVARCFRANRIPALILVYISNPYTVIPMYWLEYKLGALVFGQTLDHDQFVALLEQSTWMERVRLLIWDLALPMWLGGIMIGLACALPSYYATRSVLTRRAARRRAKKEAAAAVSDPMLAAASHPDES